MNWLTSEQVQELFAMATPTADTRNLRYMPLADFRTVKNDNLALQKYTQISGNNNFPQSQITQIHKPIDKTQII